MPTPFSVELFCVSDTDSSWSPPGAEDKLQPWLWPLFLLCWTWAPALALPCRGEREEARNDAGSRRGEIGLYVDNRHTVLEIQTEILSHLTDFLKITSFFCY